MTTVTTSKPLSATAIGYRRTQIAKYVDLKEMIEAWRKYPGKRTRKWDELDKLDKDIALIEEKIESLMIEIVNKHEPFRCHRNKSIILDSPVIKLQDRIDGRNRKRLLYGNKTLDSKEVEETSIKENQ